MKLLMNALQRWKTRRKMNRVFKRSSDPYGYATHPHERAKQDFLLSCLSGQRHSSALEVGCAEGIVTERLAPLCDKLLAVDISDVALGRARERCAAYPHVEFRRADVVDVLEENAYDLVLASEVLYYLDPKHFRGGFLEILRRIPRSIRPNGRVVLLHSYGSPEERENRQGYRQEMERAGLRLDFEIDGGWDPAKCKYLISSLRRDP